MSFTASTSDKAAFAGASTSDRAARRTPRGASRGRSTAAGDDEAEDVEEVDAVDDGLSGSHRLAGKRVRHPRWGLTQRSDLRYSPCRKTVTSASSRTGPAVRYSASPQCTVRADVRRRSHLLYSIPWRTERMRSANSAVHTETQRPYRHSRNKTHKSKAKTHPHMLRIGATVSQHAGRAAVGSLHNHELGVACPSVS